MFKNKEDEEEEVDDKLFADNIKYDEEKYNKLIKQCNAMTSTQHIIDLLLS